MKNYIFSSFFILFVTVLASAQRYVPLMAENRTLTEDYQGPNDLVHDMAEYNGKLLIVGQFTEINQEPFNSIAYWDGNNYSAFETPLESEIYIRDVLETPLGLVISGDFDSGNILTYTGSSWEELGAGFDGAVLETVWFENKLWAGGKFDYSGGIATQKIAYYENGSWIQAGDGLDDEVRDLIVFQDELYAVGQFNFSGVNAANHIAKWNGTSWIQVAGGLNDDANILAIYEDELLIGGKFNASADGLTPLEKLVTLNGNEFQDLASLPQNTSQIGHLNVIGDNLFMAEGRNTIDGLLDTENGLVFSDNELLDVFYDTGFSKVIEFEGDIICSSFKVDLESNDMDFFRRTALGVFKLTGSLEEDFSLNSIQTKVSCSAGLFRDLETSSAGYFTAPLDEYKSSIYQASPWIGGVSEELFISHHTYTIDNEDPFFRMGPISDSYDQEYVNKYFRVWKTTSQEISSHISNFNQPDYVTPESILYWPGNGRVEHGETAHLAPFVDVNENGWYEPLLGDYPAIEGDVAVFYILSGSRGEDLNYQNSLDADVCVLLFGFLGDNEDLGFSPFLRYRVINKSSVDFDQFKFGFWVDGDLGFSIDDFVGCSVSNNTFFTFNGDTFDEGIFGYGEHPPAQGVRFLNHDLNNHLFFNNGNGQNGDPQTSLDFWNYMNSIWQNGVPLTFGGDGYQTGNDPDNPTNWMYNMDPVEGEDVIEWNEFTVGNNPGDRRNIGASPIFELNQGEERCFDLALVTAFSPESESSHIDAIEYMLSRSSSVQDFYNETISPCGPQTYPLGVENPLLETLSVNVFPNPSSETITLEGLDSVNELVVSIYDITGKLVKSMSEQINSIDISDLDSGTYFLTVVQKNDLISRLKLVVQ